MKLRSSSALGATLALLPSLASACPVCAGRETDTSLVLLLVGIMIAVPYAISVVAIRIIRKADRDSAWLEAPLPPTPASPEAPRR